MRLAFWRKDRCSRTRWMLSAYIDRRLDFEQSAEVEQHLSECKGCREELESLRATVALLQRLPEVRPSRSFTLAPVKPSPARNPIPALRFATTAVVLLLVLAFAADRTNLFTTNDSSSYLVGPGVGSGEGVDYWLVPGVVGNSAGAAGQTPVNLLVPDQTEDVYAAVNSLSADGVISGNMAPGPDGVLRLVAGNGDAASAGGQPQKFLVISTCTGTGHFSTNNGWGPTYVVTQDEEILNMVPADSDNTMLYSFDLSRSTSVATYGEDAFSSAVRGEVSSDAGGYLGVSSEGTWLRPLQYGLAALGAMLAVLTVAVWLKHKREGKTGV